jgi:hypothetical protein
MTGFDTYDDGVGDGPPVDFTKKLREHRRRRTAACRHPVVSSDRKGFDVCISCGDSFPCRVACGHVDCLIRRQEMGALIVVPETMIPQGVRVIDTETGRVLFDTSDEDPLEWYVPGVSYE